jgi:4-alpha-glucanotransferase
MPFARESGILLHPTSLPGRHGIGDFGPSAFRFVDWLVRANQRLWQVMPLGPTGFGDSPYAAASAFAGNPLLISLDWVAGDGLLDPSDLNDAPVFPDERVDFQPVVAYKERILRVAFDRFRRGAGAQLRSEFDAFRERERRWLDDFALFLAVKDAHGKRAWQDWDEPIRLREPAALEEWTQRLSTEIRYFAFVQFLFARQWGELKKYANDRNVRLVGDIPIFVAEDSSDVWTNRHLFKLDELGRPTEVAGVPPDPFAATGQRWGNPVYNWPAMRSDGYAWWVDRIRTALNQVDIVRIDHFRGFAAAWMVPAADDTAANGHWELAPGEEVFASIRTQLGDVPFIIEDLGVITPDVVALRQSLGFPGMNVLHFAFDGDPANAYLPHNYESNSVVYTATHDNQTTVGWFNSRPDHERAAIQRYIGTDGADIAWDLVRLAYASIASVAIVPLQDVLRLDDSARMNVPGQPIGNWSWRYKELQLEDGLAQGLREWTVIFGRSPDLNVPRDPNPWDYTAGGSQHQAVDPFVSDVQ